MPPEDLVTTPDVLIAYEIPPAKRQLFAAFQQTLMSHRSTWWGANVEGWRCVSW